MKFSSHPATGNKQVPLDILDEVYPGVWASGIASKAKHAKPLQGRLKPRAQPTYKTPSSACPWSQRPQNYLLLNGKIQGQVGNPNSPGPRYPKASQSSPTLFGNQLAEDLEGWTAPPGEGVLLQYVDDLLIATETLNSCRERTVSLLNFHGLDGCKVSQQKAETMKQEVTYLGYEVSEERRKLGQEGKETMCQTPQPQDAQGTWDISRDDRLVSALDLQLWYISKTPIAVAADRNEGTAVDWGSKTVIE
ncbi:uncharacterized protein PRD47_007882 [Ara ararauna]